MRTIMNSKTIKGENKSRCAPAWGLGVFKGLIAKASHETRPTPLDLSIRRQRQAGLFESEASLVYRLSLNKQTSKA